MLHFVILSCNKPLSGKLQKHTFTTKSLWNVWRHTYRSNRQVTYQHTPHYTPITDQQCHANRSKVVKTSPRIGTETEFQVNYSLALGSGKIPGIKLSFPHGLNILLQYQVHCLWLRQIGQCGTNCIILLMENWTYMYTCTCDDKYEWASDLALIAISSEKKIF